MNSYEQKAYLLAQQARERQIAVKITDGIQKLYDSSESHKRWVWELIQNAHDVYEGSNLEIEIIQKSDSLTFKHNGKPFSMMNIVYLIEQISTKERSEEQNGTQENNHTIGKYGTGFLTTHLLSKKVEIESIFCDEDQENVYKPFTLKLDRSGETLEEILNGVKESFEVIKTLDKTPNLLIDQRVTLNGKCNTKFKYIISNNESQNTLKEGIDSLILCLPFVFAFSKKLSRLTISTEESLIVYTKTTQKHTDNLTLNTILCNSEERHILTIEEHSLALAIELLSINKEWTIKANNPALPTFFVYFPLIGSEATRFPFVVHSHAFIPNEPRSNILLEQGNSVSNNRQLILYAFNLYKNFLKVLINYSDIHFFCQFPNNSGSRFGLTWMDQQLDNIRSFIADQPIVTNSVGKQISLKQMRFVFEKNIATSVKLSELMKHIVSNVPKIDEEYFTFWKEFISNDWNKWNVKVHSVNSFLERIEQEKNIDGLLKYFNYDEKTCFQFLNELYSVCCKCPEYSEYAFIPNQNKNFKRVKDLYCENQIEDVLKNVSKDLGKDFREILLHKSMSCKLVQHIGNQDVVKYININMKITHVDQICQLSLLIPENGPNWEKRSAIAEMICEFYKRKEGFIYFENNEINDAIWEKSDKFLHHLFLEELKKMTTVKDLSDFGIDDPYTFIINLHKYLQPPQNFSIYPNNNDNLMRLENLKFNRIAIDLNNKKFQNPNEICDKLIELKSLYSDNLNDLFIHDKISDYISPRDQYSLNDIVRDIDNFLSDENNYKKSNFKSIYQIMQFLSDRYKFDEFEKFKGNKSTMFFAMLDKKEQNFIAENFKDPHFIYKYEAMKNISLDKVETILKIVNNPEKLAHFESLMDNSALNSKSIISIKNSAANNISRNENSHAISTPISNSMKDDNQSSARDFLLNHGITKSSEFSKICDNLNSFENSNPTPEDYVFVTNIIQRSVQNTIKTLKTTNGYIVGEVMFCGNNGNILKGITYNSVSIEIVVRPKDNGFFIIHDKDEINYLKKKDNQLWIDDGVTTPSQCTFGEIIECNSLLRKKIMIK